MRNTLLLAVCAAAAGCGTAPQPSAGFPVQRFASFNQSDPNYRLFPGDEIEVTVYSAPELDRTLRVGPDGRVQMPLSGPVLAIDRTIPELRTALVDALSEQLVDPKLDLFPVSFGSQQVFVGGEVGQPGVYELPGQIDALQGIILAGGFTNDSRPEQVVVIRRLPGGKAVSRVVNLREGIVEADLADFTPLQRFDVIYVPKSRIAEQNLFVQQYIRSALPVDFSLFYDLAGNRN